MNYYIWLTDTYLMLSFITTLIFICSWWWVKTPVLKTQPPTNFKKHVRNKYKLFFENAPINSNIARLYLYVLTLIIVLLIYWYTWSFYYTLNQWKFLNMIWFYLFNIILLSIIIWRLYTEWVGVLNLNTETVSVVTLLLLTFFVYLNFSNLLILLLLLECQGIIFAYFIIQNHNNIKVNRTAKNLLSSLKQSKIWRTNALFIQFWVNFFGAALLFFAASQLGSLIGILHWFDISKLTTLTLYTLCVAPHKLTWAFIFTILGFMIKIGFAPFHFWKPELYKNLSYLTIFIYATIYIYAILVLFIHIVQSSFTLINTTITKAIWIILIISLYILLALLFYISDFKIFIAYTSVAHLTYLITIIIVPQINFYTMLFYTLAYILVITALFFIILAFKRAPLIYLTDLQLLTQVPHLMFMFIITIAAMAGLPPLIGFWAKLAVILTLWNAHEYVLALHVLGCGLFLMYFYFQNYRFTFVVNPKINVKATQLVNNYFINTCGIYILFLCFISCTFVNDLLIWAYICLT